MADIAATLTSKTDEHFTPQNVLDLVAKVGPIALDPCWHPDSLVKPTTASYHYAGGEKQSWRKAARGGLIFVNPPYSDIAVWARKCSDEGRDGAKIIALLPSRTGARWFENVHTADALLFWRGRLRFLGSKNCAPFDSALACWNCAPAFRRAFAGVGWFAK